ncbi:hypothetical protein LQW54_011419 [Pestalotiopsis sp. IQ-011]
MVLGALLFGILMRTAAKSANNQDSILAKNLLSGALFFAGIGFLVAVFVRSEVQLFGAFMFLEACNGIYVPSMAFQRGKLVNETGRASVYGLMNIPLFMFVIVALSMADKAGDQNITFIFCAVLLMVAAATSFFSFRGLQSLNGLSELPLPENSEPDCMEY